MNTKTPIGYMALAVLLLAGLGCADNARSEALGDGKPYSSGDGKLVFPMPWNEYELPGLDEEREPKKVTLKFGGTGRIRALYGDDPEAAKTADSIVVDGGKGWRLYGGFVYLTGYWRYLETERVRTITWGTRVAARIAPKGDYVQPDGSTVTLPDRDQIFVIDGDVWVFPKGSSSGKPIPVETGEYVYASTDAATGEVTIEGPYSIPEQGDALVEDYAVIIPFLTMVKSELP